MPKSPKPSPEFNEGPDDFAGRVSTKPIHQVFFLRGHAYVIFIETNTPLQQVFKHIQMWIAGAAMEMETKGTTAQEFGTKMLEMLLESYDAPSLQAAILKMA